MDTVGMHRRARSLVLAMAMGGLALGAGFAALGATTPRNLAWGTSTLLVLVPTAASAGSKVLRGETGVDVIALLAMTGSLVLGEYLAGAILAVMLTGGTALEDYAVARARRELTALLERAPRIAHRRHGDGVLDIPVSEVAIGDVLLVKQGEIVPTDGLLVSEEGALDESAITGESRVAEMRAGDPIRSGATCAAAPFEFRATARAEESTYAGIVRLVRAAETSKAPFVRLADRYATWFLFVALALSAAAWLVSGEPVRALSVLVVATPCPLLLAAPAAIIAGVSRAARYGIIIKGGGPLEILALARSVLLDKTGTITRGRARVIAVETLGAKDSNEVVRVAASVEQLSSHPFAPAILVEARDRGLVPSFPSDAHEQLGLGIEGSVDGHRVVVGQLGFVAPSARRAPGVRSVQMRTAAEGSSSVFVAIDDVLEGVLILEDPIRSDAPRALHELRRAGIGRIHMVTGDHPDVAELVGDAVGVDKVLSERSPEEKVAAIRAIRAAGTTIMVGDGVNDAPALALADVGVAMGARGATAASEAADVVLTVDRLDGLVWAVRIAQRTRRIALQSVTIGMGMSLVAMLAAAGGLLAPAAGAILQEGIDVAVILNALRALGGRDVIPRRSAGNEKLAVELRKIHTTLRPRVDELATLPSRLDDLAPEDARRELEGVREFLTTQLLPHEQNEQRSAYPVVARLFEGEDPTGPLIRTHHEIARFVRLFGRLLDQVSPDGPHHDDLRDLRRVLYGLHAILKLHFAQEDELYSALETPVARTG